MRCTLFTEEVKQTEGWMDNSQRAKKPSSQPVVFTKEEVQAILRNFEGAKP
jgi:hypothetical protein